MIGTRIKTIDLIEITNAARAFKQKDILLYNNKLYGLDNLKTINTYTSVLNLSYVYPIMQFNYRALSAFTKNITIEEYFIVDKNYQIHTDFKAVDDKMVDTITLAYDMNAKNIIDGMNNINDKLRMFNIYQEPIECTEEFRDLFSLRMTDGTIYHNHRYNGDRNYFMILFSGLLPLNKADKIYMNIYDNQSNIFTVQFTVNKKGLRIYTYISYLKV